MIKRFFLSISFFMFLFLFSFFTFLGKYNKVLANDSYTYQCGHDLDWCQYGYGAFLPNYCPTGTKLIHYSTADETAYCCPNDFEYINTGARKYCCRFNSVAKGANNLCCPDGYTPKNSFTEIRHCENLRDITKSCSRQNQCDQIALEENQIEPGETLKQGFGRIFEPNRIPGTAANAECPSPSCEYYRFGGYQLPEILCYEENAARVDSDPRMICVQGNWEEATEECGINGCQPEIGEDDPENPNYCPTDCESGNNGSGNDGDRYNNNPPEIPTCGEICVSEGEDEGYCLECICAGGKDSTEFTNNVWTELGCITPTQEGVISAIMRVFFGIVTGVALIRFVQAAIYLNSDDPEKKKEGKSIVMSAMAALALGASLPVVLNFLGIDILGIGSIV